MHNIFLQVDLSIRDRQRVLSKYMSKSCKKKKEKKN